MFLALVGLVISMRVSDFSPQICLLHEISLALVGLVRYSYQICLSFCSRQQVGCAIRHSSEICSKFKCLGHVLRVCQGCLHCGAGLSSFFAACFKSWRFVGLDTLDLSADLNCQHSVLEETTCRMMLSLQCS